MSGGVPGMTPGRVRQVGTCLAVLPLLHFCSSGAAPGH
jgi:hypothetical protein